MRAVETGRLVDAARYPDSAATRTARALSDQFARRCSRKPAGFSAQSARRAIASISATYLAPGPNLPIIPPAIDGTRFFNQAAAISRACRRRVRRFESGDVSRQYRRGIGSRIAARHFRCSIRRRVDNPTASPCGFRGTARFSYGTPLHKTPSPHFTSHLAGASKCWPRLRLPPPRE